MDLRKGLKGYAFFAAGLALIAMAGCAKEEKKAEAPKEGTAMQAPAEQPQTQMQTAQPPAVAQPAEEQALPKGHPPLDKAAQNGADKQQARKDTVPPAMPPGPSHANIKSGQKEVRLTDAIKAKYNEVKIDVTDGSSNSTESFTIKVGSSASLKAKGFKLKVEAFVPDYSISGNFIESRSDTLRNPAVLVELVSGDKGVAKGWIFKNFTDFNSYNDARFKVKLVGP